MQIHREYLRLRIDAIDNIAPWLRRAASLAGLPASAHLYACGPVTLVESMAQVH